MDSTSLNYVNIEQMPSFTKKNRSDHVLKYQPGLAAWLFQLNTPTIQDSCTIQADTSDQCWAAFH